MTVLSDGDRVHLVDRKGRQYALTLKAGDTFQLSGETLAHDDLIGKPDGTLVTLSHGRRMLAIRPTLSEYVLKMPRGAQVLYPKDLGVILQWADIYPGSRVFEAGTGSGALTMALLRAVGDRGHVISYESREDFARTAMKNIDRYLVPSTTSCSGNAMRMKASRKRIWIGWSWISPSPGRWSPTPRRLCGRAGST